jgi:hypothetical protein
MKVQDELEFAFFNLVLVATVTGWGNNNVALAH